MTTVTFDNETIADALAKANKIAPRLTSKTGHTAGIVIRIEPGQDDPVQIRATDGQVFWDHWVDVVEVTGEPAEWRMLGDGIATLASGLPFGKGKRVTFSDEGELNRIDITRPGLKAWIAQLTADSFPMWEPYDEDFTEPVDGLGERLELVAWAAHKDDTVIPWSGVMFDGERIMASDSYRFAAVPCKIPISEPVTLAVGKIVPLIKHSGSVRVGVHKGHLLICPDGYSQVSSAVFGRNYPSIDHVLREDYEFEVVLNKSEVGAYVRRAVQMAARQDSPGMVIVLGNEEMELQVRQRDGTEGYEQTFAMPGAYHDPVQIPVTPQMFLDVMLSGGGDETTMHYDATKQKRKPRLYFSGPSGYQAWMQDLVTGRAK